MATEVSPQALVSREQVQGALLRSDEGDVLRDQALDPAGAFIETGVAEIEGVSDRIRDYLDRQLMAAEVSELTSDRDWQCVDRHPTDLPYRLYAREWPVLAVTDPDTATTQVGRTMERIFAEEVLTPKVTYLAGYRRSDQVAADFPTAVSDELATEDIPELPPLIVHVASNMVVHRLTQRLSGLVGISEEEQQTGDWEVEVRKRRIDQEFEMRHLRQLTKLRHIA
jgi:hypothetical protein